MLEKGKGHPKFLLKEHSISNKTIDYTNDESKQEICSSIDSTTYKHKNKLNK